MNNETSPVDNLSAPPQPAAPEAKTMNPLPKICGTCRKRDPDTGWCGHWGFLTDSAAACGHWAPEEADEPAPDSASLLPDRSPVAAQNAGLTIPPPSPKPTESHRS